MTPFSARKSASSPTCVSTNCLELTATLRPRVAARLTTSRAMSSKISRDHPSDALKATHHVRDDADVGHQARCNTRERHGTQHVLDTEGSQPTAPASLMSSQAAAAVAACDEFLQSAHPSDAAREMIAAELLTRCGK